MFICCHPSISADSQIALTLRTLCGFSIAEIAKAFLTSEANISKRSVRARKTIRENRIPFEMPENAFLEQRLSAVLETIYLLFNEGYSASVGTDLIRSEVCEEAIRLAELIATHPSIPAKEGAYALLALMQLNASRFGARQDVDGNIITLEHQNRSLWDYSMMEKGFSNLNRATTSTSLSTYHYLAAISAYHCSAASYDRTDWSSILALYDKLIMVDNSPIALLNRSIALAKVSGAKKALAELKKIANSPTLTSYHLFYVTKAEFHIQLDQYSEAVPLLEKALSLAPLPSEKVMLKGKLKACLEK